MANGAKVRYVGKAHRRIVERYEWNADNGFVQTVTSQTLVDKLLANGGFEIIETATTLPKEEDTQ